MNRLQSIVNDTTRCYPRRLRDAFPHEYEASAIGINGPVVEPTRHWLVQLCRWLVGPQS